MYWASTLDQAFSASALSTPASVNSRRKTLRSQV